MKVIESYGKGTVAGCRDTKAVFFKVISGFPSTSYAKFYSTKRKSAKKMLRIHHVNLFRTHRSLWRIFRSPLHWAILTIRIVSIAQCDGDLKK